MGLATQVRVEFDGGEGPQQVAAMLRRLAAAVEQWSDVEGLHISDVRVDAGLPARMILDLHFSDVPGRPRKPINVRYGYRLAEYR